MALKSGKVGYAKIGSTSYKFDSWRFLIDDDLQDVSHFEAGGGQVLADGIITNEVEMIGPYDVGAMALTGGGQVVVHCGLDEDGDIELSATCRLKSIDINCEYKGGRGVKAVFKSSDGANFVGSIS